MKNINRRKFLKLGAAVATVVGEANILKGDGDFSPKTGKERRTVPGACWSCSTRDSMIGYIEDGRLVKLEGQPDSIRGRGKICAKGQAGVNQLYDPDRILYPMKRAGKRGEGKWVRITWDEALSELAQRLKKLRDEGHPEKFMFHYGRMKASVSKIVKSVFLKTYGTKTIGNHTSICEGGKWTAQELTWGRRYDNWDFENANYALNFGSNCLEAHTNHIPIAQRLVDAMADNRIKMTTFDVRLSNTAARSSEWVPIRPGTDAAVVLAMCHVVIKEGLYDRDFMKFVKATKNKNASTEEKIAALEAHLSKYTPEWAQAISGVNASKIETLAIEFAKAKAAVLLSYRGAVSHYNGVDTERACQMLASITGNIDNPGGRCRAVAPKWKYPKGPKEKPKGKKLDILDGFKGDAIFPTHHISHQVFKMIKDGRRGRPDIYMWSCHAPVYANGEIQENIEVLKDERMLPFTVCFNPYYDESAALADMILPNSTYLEWWGWEDMVSPNQVPEFYIRQPMVPPLGESRDMCDVFCELAERLGFPLGFNSAEEFLKQSCEMTPEVKKAGGFSYMKKHGVWHDPKAKPEYYKYKQTVKNSEIEKDGVVYDQKTGVFWNWKKSKAKTEKEAIKKGYAQTKNAYKGYVAQSIDGAAYKGFEPDRLNKSGYMELYSNLLEEKGWNPLPEFKPSPETSAMKPDELLLITYKVNVQTHSRTANCKWLTEICHDNPGWINPVTAASFGVKTGDKIRVKSTIAEIETKAFVTEGVSPGVIAISHHCGHWEYGRFASGKKSPTGNEGDPDLKLKWWTENGTHPNWITPNRPEPVAGQQRWNDVIVRIEKI